MHHASLQFHGKNMQYYEQLESSLNVFIFIFRKKPNVDQLI